MLFSFLVMQKWKPKTLPHHQASNKYTETVLLPDPIRRADTYSCDRSSSSAVMVSRSSPYLIASNKLSWLAS